LAWTIDYTETARRQLRKLDKTIARRVADFFDERIASTDDPRSLRKALK
jgi:mRNA interferase RelE/StbE